MIEVYINVRPTTCVSNGFKFRIRLVESRGTWLSNQASPAFANQPYLTECCNIVKIWFKSFADSPLHWFYIFVLKKDMVSENGNGFPCSEERTRRLDMV